MVDVFFSSPGCCCALLLALLRATSFRARGALLRTGMVAAIAVLFVVVVSCCCCWIMVKCFRCLAAAAASSCRRDKRCWTAVRCGVTFIWTPKHHSRVRVSCFCGWCLGWCWCCRPLPPTNVMPTSMVMSHATECAVAVTLTPAM
jgi:hypothetical protein